MKISSYLYPGADRLAGSVADIMALYAIPAGEDTGGDGRYETFLPPHAVAVRNTVLADPVTVATEIFFWEQPEKIGRLAVVSPTAADGETEQAAAKRLTRLNLLTLLTRLTGVDPGPWGILRGVRPTKIPHKLFDQGLSPDEIIPQLTARYALTPAKAGLLAEIACRQRPFLSSGPAAKKLVSIYIGIPYCPSRCLYCSFPAQALPRDKAKLGRFLAALEKDILAAQKIVGRYGLSVETVYIGGGTPTSLAAEDFERLLALVNQCFRSPALREFTVEAGRPDSLDDAKISAMRRAGVSRASVNPQTMQQKTLKLIGRNHTVEDIIVMLNKMRYQGIPALNMDIIVGLPGEGEAEIADTMRQIARLAPDNLTVHTLAVKKGSLLKDNSGGFSLPNEAVAARMLAIADDYACKMGMVPYYLYRQKYMLGNLENIGYSRPGGECIYNIKIIEERQTIIGIGPAAATKAADPDGRRLNSCYNPKDVATYIKNLGTYLDRRAGLLARLFES